MAQENKTVDQMYDEQSAKQQAKLAALHDSSTQRYEGLRAAADAAYQKLKTEAYINKALSDLAGGPAPASMTHRQRGVSALLRELGAAERKRGNYSREIDLALKNLDVQHAADLAYADAMNEVRREAERLQRSRFDAEMGIRRDYFELDKKNATFDRMYKLYTSRRIDKDAFRDATGYAVKAMPAPKRKKARPMVIFVGANKPEKNTPGYITMHFDHASSGARVYYEVEEKAAKAMIEKGLTLQDVSGQVRSDPELYAIGHYKGFAGADVKDQIRILEANKEDLVGRFGKAAFYNQQYKLVLGAAAPIAGMKNFDSLTQLNDFVSGWEDYIKQYGEDRFYDELSSLLNTVLAHTEIYLTTLSKDNAYRLSDLKEHIPDIIDKFPYTDSEADQFRKANGIVPESFSWDRVVAMMDLPDWYQPPQVWDEQGITDLLNTYKQHEYWTGLLGEDYDLVWTDRMPTPEELKEKGFEYARKQAEENGGASMTEINDEHAIILGVFVAGDEIAEKKGYGRRNTREITRDSGIFKYTWSPKNWITYLVFTDEKKADELDVWRTKDAIDNANNAIANILYCKYINHEEEAGADYELLNSYGMTDIVHYLRSLDAVEYSDLPESIRKELKDLTLSEGLDAYYELTQKELDFLKNASVEEIDLKLAREMKKQKPDEQWVNALKLYRYYKNDLGITVTGDYEADRAAAKKALISQLTELTGMDDFQDILYTNAANQESVIKNPKVKISWEWQRVNQLLQDAPPELFMNTEEETKATYESGDAAFIGGLRKGFTLGLASLKKRSVADPKEFKRLALLGNPVGGTEFYKQGRFYTPSIAEEDVQLLKNNKTAYYIGNVLGSLPATIAIGSIVGNAAQAFNLSRTAANALGAAVPAMIRGGADAAARGGSLGDIILNAVMNGAFAAASFGAIGKAAQTAASKLMTGAPALLQKTLPLLANASVTAIADTGFNLLGDTLMGRNIDWSQTFANMSVDFLFSLFLNGKSGDAYLDPKTGERIEVPEGKTLKSVNPEAARFYEELGNTRVTGELHNAIGDIYLQYLDIPEKVVPNADFTRLETAYRNYEANNTVANATAFLEEAGKVQRIAVGKGYNIESPYARVNAAIEAKNVGDASLDKVYVDKESLSTQGSMDEIDSETSVGDNSLLKIYDEGTRRTEQTPEIKYPGNDPGKSPGKDWEWRGEAQPGSSRGNWYNPKTGESLHPDLGHSTEGKGIGPHWDYKSADGKWYRIFPNGIIQEK